MTGSEILASASGAATALVPADIAWMLAACALVLLALPLGRSRLRRRPTSAA